jgi:hypothetical protein
MGLGRISMLKGFFEYILTLLEKIGLNAKPLSLAYHRTVGGTET